MSELNVAAKTRMIAKGLFSSGDERRAHAVNCAADEIDKLTEQNACMVEMLDKIIKEADYSYALDVDLYDSANQLLTEIKGQEL